MTILTLWLLGSAHAALVNSGECLIAAAHAKSCCDAPLSDACLDPDAKALNDKLHAYQESLARKVSGLHDATAEAKARAEAMQTSAALNQRSAQKCEDMVKKCVSTCSPVPTADGKAAGQRCQDLIKVIVDLREQASRDEAQAKRLRRGSK